MIRERVFGDLDDEEPTPRERFERRARIARAAYRVAQTDLELVDDRRVFEESTIGFAEAVEDFAREVVEEESPRFFIACGERRAPNGCVSSGAARGDERKAGRPAFGS